jgi:epoxyqueuosine reductase
MNDLKTEILAEAKRLGFLLAGVSHPGPLDSYQRYVDWLDAGRHGEMAYMASERARQRRSDLRFILPEVKSILALGLPYQAPLDTHGEPGQVQPGKVAAYAAGEDYHHTIPSLLEKIVLFTQECSGQPVIWRGYTDTGPILERELAQRAGLGWIGKNSCLISPQYGSYFLLAEILWDISLAPDQALGRDYCGSCTRCIDACPTDCILPNRTLDSRRCISYLTIEKKGEIPPELRPLTGEWVFGCDICQQVCPWNVRFASARPETAFPGPPEAQRVELPGELSLSPQAFNQKYRQSPIRRARRRGYLRNICVALGNQANPGSTPHLRLALLSDPESLVRAHAAWALGRSGGQAAQDALAEALQTETDPQVLAEIKNAIQKV